jgi:hypothetical protein
MGDGTLARGMRVFIASVISNHELHISGLQDDR